MWFDDMAGSSWTSLWSGYVRCSADCAGIRKIDEPCVACDAPPYDPTPQTVTIDGQEMIINSAFMGAEGRYEDYVLLQMLQREWERPVEEFAALSHFGGAERPSARAALVLLFWTYLETRIERLHRAAMRALPPRIVEDQLQRYSGIGSRLFRLYQVNFDTNYFDDLTEHGFGGVSAMLRDIHRRRNDFSHGKPQAITDDVVNTLVENLRNEHESWIAVFNTRVRTSVYSTST